MQAIIALENFGTKWLPCNYDLKIVPRLSAISSDSNDDYNFLLYSGRFGTWGNGIIPEFFTAKVMSQTHWWLFQKDKDRNFNLNDNFKGDKYSLPSYSFEHDIDCDGGISTNGLVAYYPFNSNANDESGNSNDGTEHGGLSYVAGVHGQAVNLDGVDDYISVADDNTLDLTTTGTISAWMKLGSPTSIYNSIIGKAVGSSGGQVSYELIVGGNAEIRTQGYVNNGSVNTSALSNHNMFDNTWHHAAFTWNGSVGNIYIDGVLDNDSTSAGTGGFANTFTLYLGRFNHTGKGVFYTQGALDDVAIYNRALSESEIQALAQ